MNIEVKGIGFPNKGAELMLSSIRAWHSQIDPGGRIVLSSQSPYSNRARYGAWQNFSRERLPANCLAMVNLIPKRILDEFGIIKDRDIDVIFDASGFAYGDQWGAKKIYNRLVKRIPVWKSRSTKLILLPQAFGPFKDPVLREYMRRVIDFASLVYARDRISYDFLRDIAPNAPSLRMAPDFTCLVDGTCPPSLAQFAGKVCIIPNHKVVEHTSTTEQQYVSFLSGLCTKLSEKGLIPFLLLHEGPKDKKLCEKITASLGFDCAIVAPQDAETIKGVIRHSHAAVTSRFHGFVSALSKGVPAYATSWSHKYEMLAEDYENPELVLKNFSGETIDAIIATLTDPASYDKVKRSLLRAAEKNRTLTKGMWKEIEAALGCNPTPVAP